MRRPNRTTQESVEQPELQARLAVDFQPTVGESDYPSSRFRLDQRRREQWDHQLVVASQLDALARAACGSLDDVMVGAIVLKKVEIHGGELCQRKSKVSH